MFDKAELKKVISEYISVFIDKQWPSEKYKWEAIKCFQDNWNLDAHDFADMLTKSLSKTYNLLNSKNNYPAAMIENFAKQAPEEVKAMFIALFDETQDVVKRILEFKDKSSVLLKKYGNEAEQDYQSENAISIYLWLRYPDKYYIYKFSELKKVATKLKSDFKFKRGSYKDNLYNFYSLYDEICESLKQDISLRNLLYSQLTDTCYKDPELKTLTVDVGFYISRFFNEKDDINDWWPALEEYSPDLSVKEWIDLLQDPEVFHKSSLEIMKRIMDYGGQATCKQLAVKYGENINFYNTGSSALAKRIAKKTGCPVMPRNVDNTRWWPILYVGKNASEGEEGSFIWRLRDELSEALKRIDLSQINLFVNQQPAFWKISHGTECITDEEAEIFAKRQVIVVNKYTAAKGTVKTSQGNNFMMNMKKGDYFYLCRGNSIRLLGVINSDKVYKNPEKQEEWYERTYSVIAESQNIAAYTGKKKWWTPNDNSTCIAIPENENKQLDEYILKPYFGITIDELLSDCKSAKHYWFLNANPKMWSMSDMPVGEVQDYTLYNDNGNKRRIFKNFIEAQKGDMVIGYESTPVKQIVAIMEVSEEQDGEAIYFKKLEGLSSPIEYSVLKACPELENMEYFTMQQGSLFKLTQDEYEFILDMIREDNPKPVREKDKESYGKKEFLSEVYMNEARYDRLVSVLKRKKNIILQGAPGVGKTFAAKRLAYSIMGEKDDDRIEFVQFHQNYTYEDFIMGYKPSEEGFKLKNGIFYSFCQKAANNPEKDYFFIIDEINRGNMSKIFGELLMSIEADYRGKKVTLAYNGRSFSVPTRLYIIGMMNTADRSLAMIDYALRRRFSFFEIEPGFDSYGFRAYQKGLNNEIFDELISRVKELNKEITADKSLGKGFCIGHSYFCGSEECTTEWMQEVVEYDILPMLSEYWFDDLDKLQRWENILHGIFQ